MIDFRYHIVSIVAVFLALGIGIIVGTTTLNGPILDNLRSNTHSLAQNNTALTKHVDNLNGQLSAAQAYDAAVLPLVVADRLNGRSVTLVSGPNVSTKTRTGVAQALHEAGATVAADIQLTGTYVDPTQDALLDSLASRLVRPDVTLPEGATGAQRAAVQLASVLVRPSEPGKRTAAATTSADDDLAATLAAYGDGQLLDVHGDNPRRGTLAVVLAGDPVANPDVEKSTDGALEALASALDAASDGVVLAGTSAAADAGVLADAKHVSGFGDKVTTVAAVEQPAGLAAVVFGLVGEAAGRAGSYDSPAAAVGALPSASPSP